MRDTEVVHKKLIGSTALPDALRYKLLKSHSRRLLKVDVRLAPKIMQRHRENISFYSVRDKLVYWCVEIKLYLGASEHVHLIDPVPQSIRLDELLKSTDIYSTDVLAKHNINL
jgi:hypothetical protein